MRRLALMLAIAAVGLPAAAQTYTHGQNVSPAYEGWERDEDGKLYFMFGYMNSNWEERFNVAVGDDNFFSPGPADQGQPTHFQPRRNRFVFRTPVPAGFGEGDELTWTLTTNGKTESAYATLQQDYFVDGLVQASEQGALGAGSSNPTIRSNKAPVLELIGNRRRTVKVGETIELISVAKDDGIPATKDQIPITGEVIFAARHGRELGDLRWMPHQHLTVGSATGLRHSWFVFRGDGEKVSFDPLQDKVWEDTRTGANSPWALLWKVPPVPEDGQWVVRTTFDEPGEYTLRCLASDGALGRIGDVVVTVTD
ncbi:MAG: hypothetical protein VYE73_10855 [Acidobacteriota bacterium]|nr:hypothetical protein [Acidobacteriota bacterium]